MSNRDCTTDQLLERLFATVPEVAVVGSAADGREAVTLADQTAPDVVLMDIGMPELARGIHFPLPMAHAARRKPRTWPTTKSGPWGFNALS